MSLPFEVLKLVCAWLEGCGAFFLDAYEPDKKNYQT